VHNNRIEALYTRHCRTLECLIFRCLHLADIIDTVRCFCFRDSQRYTCWCLTELTASSLRWWWWLFFSS